MQIPKICCLNRHCALLPAYGGLFPVLQAYRSGERFTGASVHIMGEEIDVGPVLAQKEIEINNADTIASLYKRCYAASVDVLLEALERVRAGDFTPYANMIKPSYFSFPEKEHWRQFRKRGGKFI